MNSQEFRDLQAQIGCRGTKIAEWLGVKPLTVTRWRTGAVPVPGPVALSMKALASGWRP